VTVMKGESSHLCVRPASRGVLASRSQCRESKLNLNVTAINRLMITADDEAGDDCVTQPSVLFCQRPCHPTLWRLTDASGCIGIHNVILVSVMGAGWAFW